MSETIPTPSIQATVEWLKGHPDHYSSFMDFINDERERFFDDLRQSQNPADVMKITGSVAALHEIKQIFES